MTVPILAYIWGLAISCYLIWRVFENSQSRIATFKILPMTGSRYKVPQSSHPVWYWLIIGTKSLAAIGMLASLAALAFGWAQ